MAGWCVCTDSSTRSRWGKVEGASMCWAACSLGYDKHTFERVVRLGNRAVCPHRMMCVLLYPQVCRSLSWVRTPDVQADLLFSFLPSSFNCPVLPKFCVAYIEKKRFLKGREWSESTQSLDQGRGGVLHAISILPLFRYQYQRLCTEFSFFSK